MRITRGEEREIKGHTVGGSGFIALLTMEHVPYAVHRENEHAGDREVRLTDQLKVSLKRKKESKKERKRDGKIRYTHLPTFKIPF